MTKKRINSAFVIFEHKDVTVRGKLLDVSLPQKNKSITKYLFYAEDEYGATYSGCIEFHPATKNN